MASKSRKTKSADSTGSADDSNIDRTSEPGPDQGLRDQVSRQMLQLMFKSQLEFLSDDALAGDLDAAATLVELATQASQSVQHAATQSPELFRQIAGKRMSWPINFNPLKHANEFAKQTVEDLSLGDALDDGINPAKLFDRRIESLGDSRIVVVSLFCVMNPLRDWALDFAKFQEIVASQSVEVAEQVAALAGQDFLRNEETFRSHCRQFVISDEVCAMLARFSATASVWPDEATVEAFLDICMALPPLSGADEAQKKWFQAMRKTLLALNDQNPERQKFLRPIGISAADKNASAERNSKTSEANIRQKLFEHLKRTLGTLAVEQPDFLDTGE